MHVVVLSAKLQPDGAGVLIEFRKVLSLVWKCSQKIWWHSKSTLPCSIFLSVADVRAYPQYTSSMRLLQGEKGSGPEAWVSQSEAFLFGGPYSKVYDVLVSMLEVFFLWKLVSLNISLSLSLTFSFSSLQ